MTEIAKANADFVAGAMNSKYNNKDSHYAQIIEKRVVKEILASDRLDYWAQKKRKRSDLRIAC